MILAHIDFALALPNVPRFITFSSSRFHSFGGNTSDYFIFSFVPGRCPGTILVAFHPQNPIGF